MQPADSNRGDAGASSPSAPDLNTGIELALAAAKVAVGDVHEACGAFLELMTRREGLQFAAAWIERDRMARTRATDDGGIRDESSRRGYALFCARPMLQVAEMHLDCEHALVRRSIRQSPFTIDSHDPEYASLVTEADTGAGAFAVFALADFGFLKLHANGTPSRFDEAWLARLRPVVDAFAAGLAGGLGRARLEQIDRQARSIESRIERAHHLESLGSLAGGVAHDFNNLLTAILGNVELLRLSRQDPEVVIDPDEAIDGIERAALRSADMCAQLMALAGRRGHSTAPSDVNVVVDEIVSLASVLRPRHTEVAVQPGDSVDPVACGRSELGRIVLNLVSNAYEALPEGGGRVCLRTGVADVDEGRLSRCAVRGGARPGRFVFVEVEDDGCGIAAEDRARVFEPLFTTRGEGRGMGLAAVRGIVAAHHGALELVSHPGQGARLCVLLPVAATEDESAAPATSHSDDAEVLPVEIPRVPRVLVADDEGGVRELLERILTAMGVEVVTAADGDEAWRRYCDSDRPIDLALLDMVMPGAGGGEVLRSIVGRDPEARVVLTSGLGAVDPAGSGPQPAAFLAKPFRVDEVRRLVRAMLGPLPDGSA